MQERLKLTDGTKSRTVSAMFQPRSGRVDVDGVTEQKDSFTFVIHRTRLNRDFLADLTNKTAEATRSMPTRILNILSVRPSEDRKFLHIECS